MMKKAMVAMSIAISLFAKTVNLEMNVKYGVSNFHTVGAANFAKKVERYTNGEVKITVYPADGLVKKGDPLKAVKNGKVAMSDMFLPFTSSGGKVFGISAMPFIASNYYDAKMYYRVSKSTYKKIFNEWNQKMLYAVSWPPTGLYTKKQINQISDIKGIKARTYDKNSEQFIKKAGGNAVALGWQEVVPSLKSKKINSVVTSSESGKDGEFWNYLDHFTKIKYAYPLQAVSINLDVWNSLSEKQQVAISKAAYETELEQWKISQKIDSNTIGLLESKGIKIHDTNNALKEELNEISKGMILKLLKGDTSMFTDEMLQYLFLRYHSKNKKN